jgi:hypothetical protein
MKPKRRKIISLSLIHSSIIITIMAFTLSYAYAQTSQKTDLTNKEAKNTVVEKILIEEEVSDTTDGESFEEFLLLFSDVSKESFTLNNGGEKQTYTMIDDILVEKFFNLEIVNVFEGCQNFRMLAVARFYLPGNEHIAIITKQLVCPIANLYEEYPMYVFDLEGNLLTEYRLAYVRGNSEGSTHVEVLIENGVITKNVTEWWQEWEDGDEGEQYLVVYDGDHVLEVSYNSATNEFVEKEIDQ